MDGLQAMLTSDVGAEAMQHDGVRPETLILAVES